jgi:hypothetical protein
MESKNYKVYMKYVYAVDSNTDHIVYCGFGTDLGGGPFCGLLASREIDRDLLKR